LPSENNPAKAITIGGGVAANSALRNRIEMLAEQNDIRALIPERIMCTDNAAMIAVCASYHYELRGADTLDAGIQASWSLSSL